MRHVVAIIFALVGAAITYFVLGDPSIGGELGEQIGVFSAGIGFVVAYPMGYLIASLPIFQPAGQSANDTKSALKQFAPQVVGTPCVVCGEKLIFVNEGHVCEVCHSVYHTTCSVDGTCPNCDKTNNAAERQIES